MLSWLRHIFWISFLTLGSVTWPLAAASGNAETEAIARGGPGRAAMPATLPSFGVPMLPGLEDRILRPLAIVPEEITARRIRVRSYNGKPPSYFEANRGQTDSRVQFLSRGARHAWFFSTDQVVLAIVDGEGRRANLRMELAGANSHAEPIGLEALPGKSNYFIGNDAARWQSGVPHYAKLLYEDIYPGIDLLYYWSAGGNLEYDFVVEPGADPGAVELRFEGPDQLEISESGDLIIGLGTTRVYHRRPVIYQEIDGDQRPVSGAYRIEGRNRVGFQLAAYDRGRPLVIDPVLEYSTFVGGSDRDREASIAADTDGNVYLTAGVRSGDFPTTMGAFDETNDSAGEETSTAIFKLGPDGTTLLFSTFLGGSAADVPRAHGNQIALDNSGHIYVSGHTMSPDFPTTAGAFDETHNGEFDLFLSVLDPTGSMLLYSTYLGGAARDQRPCIALDDAGDVYLAGQTQAPGIPTTPGAFDATYNGGADIYIAKLRPAGNGEADLLYATFLGGQGNDNHPSMTIDASGVVHIVGETESADFPTTPGAFDTTHNGGATGGGDPGDDLFVVKFDPNPAGGGTEDLLYSTFVGYPLHSGDPKILWSASRRLGVLVGDDRAVRRRIDRDRLLNESVEEFAATA